MCVSQETSLDSTSITFQFHWSTFQPMTLSQTCRVERNCLQSAVAVSHQSLCVFWYSSFIYKLEAYSSAAPEYLIQTLLNLRSPILYLYLRKCSLVCILFQVSIFDVKDNETIVLGSHWEFFFLKVDKILIILVSFKDSFQWHYLFQRKFNSVISNKRIWQS